jgi:hypothetical protein
VSGCGGSGCVGSGCLGSGCGLSGCVYSNCGGSACINQNCGPAPGPGPAPGAKPPKPKKAGFTKPEATVVAAQLENEKLRIGVGEDGIYRILLESSDGGQFEQQVNLTSGRLNLLAVPRGYTLQKVTLF